jgi:hypothetical protein
MIPQPLSRLLLVALLTLTSLAAAAGVSLTSYTISISYNFDDLDTSLAATGGTGVLFTANPWTTHDVTYDTGSNTVIGPSSGFGVASNVFSSNSGVLSGTIDGNYSWFGFDLGTVVGSSPVNIDLKTNLGDYSFANLAAPRAPVLTSFGFSAGTGEYFTSFSIVPTDAHVGAVLDNVALGNVIGQAPPIPEPGVLPLLTVGSLILGLAVRRRRHDPTGSEQGQPSVRGVLTTSPAE